MTDLLIALAEAALNGGDAEAALQVVVERFNSIARDLGMDDAVAREVEADLRARLSGDRVDAARFTDSLKAAGEDNSARLIAHCLTGSGVEARYVNPGDAGMLVSDEFGNARVLPAAYERLAALRERKGVVIFPGFFGYTPAGVLVTFARGGSDITGAILAAAVKADVYENFTDVDSVFAASPKIIDNPRAISELTYREMRELSYAGFSVFHEEALNPCFHAGVPVNIRNTNNPAAPGTAIVPHRKVSVETPIVGIACDPAFMSIFVDKYLMNREVGFGRRLLQIFEEEAVSYEHTPSGIDNISVIVRQSSLDADAEARIVARIRRELEVDDITVEHGLALIMIVGEGMQHTIGIASRITTALARSGVNIEMINQGSSEVSMMFGVKAEGAHAAVRALYEEFFGG